MNEAQISIRTLDGEGVVSGGEFDDLVEAVRGIAGRRWDPAARAWRLPCSLEQARARLQATGLRVEGSTTVIIQAGPPEELPSTVSTRPRDQVTIRAADGEAGVVGGPFREMVEVVKTIAGRRWQPQEKLWELPCSLAEARPVVEAAGLALRLPGEEPPPPSEPSGRRDQVRVQATDGEGLVVGGTFRALLEAVKTIQGRRWNPGRKVWTLPGSLAEVRRAVEAAGYALQTPSDDA